MFVFPSLCLCFFSLTKAFPLHPVAARGTSMLGWGLDLVLSPAGSISSGCWHGAQQAAPCWRLLFALGLQSSSGADADALCQARVFHPAWLQCCCHHFQAGFTNLSLLAGKGFIRASCPAPAMPGVSPPCWSCFHTIQLTFSAWFPALNLFLWLILQRNFCLCKDCRKRSVSQCFLPRTEVRYFSRVMQRLPQNTDNTSLSVAFSIPLLFWTQIDLENKVKCSPEVLWILRRDVNIPLPQWHRRATGYPRASAISLWKSEAVHSSRACPGLPAEPSAKEILSVCKGSWAAAACVQCEANTSRAEGFIGELDFYRCCINFKHLPFSAWVLPHANAPGYDIFLGKEAWPPITVNVHFFAFLRGSI